MTKFLNDLSFGKKYENLLASYLTPFYTSINKIEGKFKDYDMICDDNVKYECKCDRLSIKTGNLAIEFRCNNKESGITSTKADYYAYFIIKNPDEHDLYIIPTEDIRTKISNKEFKRTVKGGDGWRSEMYLFELSKFENYKKKI
jgi:hypothetical protein